MSLVHAYLVRALVLCRVRLRPQSRPRWSLLTDAPAGFRPGGRRASQVSGPSSCGVPWSHIPSGALGPGLVGPRAFAFRGWNPLSTQDRRVSRLISHGPLARLPTHRRAHCWTRRKASSRLAGSTLAGWDLHPLDDERDFGFIACSTSLSTSLAWSHLQLPSLDHGGVNRATVVADGPDQGSPTAIVCRSDLPSPRVRSTHRRQGRRRSICRKDSQPAPRALSGIGNGVMATLDEGERPAVVVPAECLPGVRRRSGGQVAFRTRPRC